MGLGGINIWQLLIILVIVVLIFGTKKLRGMGGDLGSAIKSFKKAVKEEPATESADGESTADNAQEQISAQEGTEPAEENTKTS